VNQLGTVDVSFQTSDVRVDAAVNIVGRTVVKKTLKGIINQIIKHLNHVLYLLNVYKCIAVYLYLYKIQNYIIYSCG